MTFLTFKISTKDFHECIRKLESLEVPQYVTLDIYPEKKPRVSEISVNVSHVPLLMSLRMSWKEFYEVKGHLENLVRNLDPKIIGVFSEYKAKMRDYKERRWIKIEENLSNL